LLHGFLKQKNVDKYIATFAEKTVITIDLLGHGETECLGYVHSMEDNAEAVQAVLAELRIRKAILVGHSMGM
jgi:pimeloyl-ACP methyl ester carboxylesterase